MTPISALLAQFTASGGTLGLTIPEDWQQGRTIYGGLSAALCVEAACRAEADLPPLRSALFSFVGPAGGAVTVTPSVLRRGKNTVFMNAALHGESGLATQATLAFGAARPSTLLHDGLPMPASPPPATCPDFFEGGFGPTFSRHFAYRVAGGGRPMAGGTPEWHLWLRHQDPAASGIAALVAIADAPPPAAMVLFKQWGPISTVTWMVDLFDAPAFQGAAQPWYLLTCHAEKIAGGYSTQHMAMWREDGVPLLLARQTIAIFA